VRAHTVPCQSIPPLRRRTAVAISAGQEPELVNAFFARYRNDHIRSPKAGCHNRRWWGRGVRIHGHIPAVSRPPKSLSGFDPFIIRLSSWQHQQSTFGTLIELVRAPQILSIHSAELIGRTRLGGCGLRSRNAYRATAGGLLDDGGRFIWRALRRRE